MPRTMWTPEAGHSYYLQEVKRRSSVIRFRRGNPKMPDENLLNTYKDLISKESDELAEMIDPHFQELAAVEQLNRPGADAQPDTNVDSKKICEDDDITLDILQEIIARDTEENQKINEETEREEKETEHVQEEQAEQEQDEEERDEQKPEEKESKEQESEVDDKEGNNVKYNAEDNVAGLMSIDIELTPDDYFMDQEFPDQDPMEEDIMQVEVMEQEFLDHAAKNLQPMDEEIMQVDPIEQDQMQPDSTNDLNATEEPMNEEAILNETSNEVIIATEAMNEVLEEPMIEGILIEEPMNGVIILDEGMHQECLNEQPRNEVVMMEDVIPIPVPNPGAAEISPSRQRANRRKQTHVPLEEVLDKEIEVTRDVWNRTRLRVRPAASTKIRPLRTYERIRRQSGPMADRRPN